MIIRLIRRALRWWWTELHAPFRSDPAEDAPPDYETNPIALPDSDWNRNSPVDFTKIKRDPTPGIYNPDGITARDLLSDDERALFAQVSPEAPEKVIAYPPKADDQDARDWVTNELERRTGGLTRHPADITDYPEPPTEADIAAQQYVRNNYRFVTPFSHGYSMRYLGELLARAKRQDRTLSTEDLMALRSRGLI